jgi:hypothetical protein
MIARQLVKLAKQISAGDVDPDPSGRYDLWKEPHTGSKKKAIAFY